MRGVVLYFLAVICVITASVPALARIMNSQVLCEGLLEGPITIQSLMEDDLVTRIGSGVFKINDGHEVSAHELYTARHLSSAIQMPILLIPSFLDIHGVPGFDGIVFDQTGEPLTNVSLKTFTVKKSRKLALGIDERRSEADKSIRKAEQRSNWERWFGAKSEVKDQWQFLFQLLGLNKSKLRPSMVVVDLSYDSTKYFKLEKLGRVQGMPPEDLVRVFDSKEELEHRIQDYISLTRLQKNLQERSTPSSYLFLTYSQALMVTESGFTLKSVD